MRGVRIGSVHQAKEEYLPIADGVDAHHPLRHMRDQFHLPPHGRGVQAYMAGNSLGLQPKGAGLTVGAEIGFSRYESARRSSQQR